MATPVTKAEFKEYCLRQLGKGVIDINVSDAQVDDRIDDALKFWADYGPDGTEKLYYKHQITTTDITNRYITLPENIIGAVKIFDLSSALGQGDMFNIQYQIALNDLYTLTSQSMVPYYMAFMHVQMLQELLVGKQPIRYNKHTDRLYIDTDWSRFKENDYVIVEAYSVLDPTTYPDLWADIWLIRLATAYIKRQWGNNLKKFEGMQMPGGLKFNGQKIFDEAEAEIKELETKIINNLSLLTAFEIY